MNCSRRLKSVLFAAIVVTVPLSAHAQYWGEQVLEKSFEHTEFFFSPSHLNPYSLGSFGSAAVGLLSEPLLNVQINPAFLATDSLQAQYAYLDFRSSREISANHVMPYYADYMRGAVIDYIGFPYYYARTRKESAPVFSGAYVVRPAGSIGRLTLGATYQLVYQDQRYYSVPQDIYRNNPSQAFAADASGGSGHIPIVDRYSGADGMQERGHFGALFAAYRLFAGADAGVRIGRTIFDRDGAFGSTNLWPSSINHESMRESMQERGQSYDHWDVSAGFNYRLSSGVIVGLTGGYLWGDVSQDLVQQDTSFYRYSSPYDDYESTYLHSGSKDQHWLHDGSSFHGGVNLLAKLTPKTNVLAYYRRSVERADIDLTSALSDTSFATSHHEYNAQPYDYVSHSSVFDARTGFGDMEQVSHRAATYFHWSVNPLTSVRMGGNLAFITRRLQTEEDVTARLHAYYLSEGHPNSYEHSSETSERKTLHWDFESRSFNLQIPVFMARRVSDAVELIFGMSRSIVGWDITDVTLAVFDFRRRTENGAEENREDFGERYTMPRERLTDTRTTVIAGITVMPAQNFNVRLMMAPHFAQGWSGTTLREFQWWIGLTATPGLGAR